MAVRYQDINNRWALYCGDCIEILPTIPDESIGYSIFSPPFCSLYSYSDSIADMGNSVSYKEFFEHFGYLIEQLYRVVMPGRLVSVHCMELPTFKKEGLAIGMKDFPGDIVRAFIKKGFIYHCRHVVWKDPLVAATRTKAIGLAHKQIVKDSAMCKTGAPDYIVSFRKPGENPVPIKHSHGLTSYHGSRSIPNDLDRYLNVKDQGKNKRSHWIWQQYASPVWFDIRQTNILPYRKARDGDDEKHICPLQLDVIERCISLWTAEEDVVLTPFMGVGSEVYVAVKNSRKGIGIELKPSYYKQALRNLRTVEFEQDQKSLFNNEEE